MLKIGSFKIFQAKFLYPSAIPQGIPMQFFLNSGESHVVVTILTHFHICLQEKFLYVYFSCLKVLRMQKIGSFKVFQAK